MGTIQKIRNHPKGFEVGFVLHEQQLQMKEIFECTQEEILSILKLTDSGDLRYACKHYLIRRYGQT